MQFTNTPKYFDLLQIIFGQYYIKNTLKTQNI
jgi:hypothetical protein